MNEMIRTDTAKLNRHLPDYLSQVARRQEIVTVDTDMGGVVLLSEARYNQLRKAERNAAYLKKLDDSFEQIRQGKVVVKTMEELRAMEEDDG